MNTPLAWYIAGPLIGIIVPLLLLLRGKQFGVSSSYRYLWSLVNKKNDYFNYPNLADKWQVHFSVGLILMGFVFYFFTKDIPLGQTESLSYSHLNFYSLSNWPNFLLGGVFVGFGARYANGCTAGHCIMGLSQLSKASLVATLGFFLGGLIVAYILNPILFQ